VGQCFSSKNGELGVDGVKRSKNTNGKLLNEKIRQALPVYKEEDYPSETFRVFKEKEMAEYGEYLTRRLVLEA
jgi:hypothetical protein